jgi:hypothetical protein
MIGNEVVGRCGVRTVDQEHLHRTTSSGQRVFENTLAKLLKRE